MVIVITGPSFSGKTTMQDLLLKSGMKRFKTCTTRQKRNVQDISYNFLTNEEFEMLIEQGKLFEFVRIDKGDHYDYYGSRDEDIKNAILSKDIYVAVFEVLGALKIKEKYPETKTIFLSVPEKILLERGILRGTETEADLNARMKRAKEIELPRQNDFDFKVENNNIDKCFASICECVRKGMM